MKLNISESGSYQVWSSMDGTTQPESVGQHTCCLVKGSLNTMMEKRRNKLGDTVSGACKA